MSDAIEGVRDNGRVIDIHFPFYQGRAGIREVGGLLQAAYLGRRPRAVGDAEGTAGGKAYRVVEASDSKETKGMVRLTLAPIDGGG